MGLSVCRVGQAKPKLRSNPVRFFAVIHAGNERILYVCDRFRFWHWQESAWPPLIARRRTGPGSRSEAAPKTLATRARAREVDIGVLHRVTKVATAQKGVRLRDWEGWKAALTWQESEAPSRVCVIEKKKEECM